MVCVHLRIAEYSVPFLVTVTVTLTIDSISRKMVSVAHILHYLRKESKMWFADASWDGDVLRTIFWSLRPC